MVGVNKLYTFDTPTSFLGGFVVTSFLFLWITFLFFPLSSGNSVPSLSFKMLECPPHSVGCPPPPPYTSGLTPPPPPAPSFLAWGVPLAQCLLLRPGVLETHPSPKPGDRGFSTNSDTLPHVVIPLHVGSSSPKRLSLSKAKPFFVQLFNPRTQHEAQQMSDNHTWLHVCLWFALVID